MICPPVPLLVSSPMNDCRGRAARAASPIRASPSCREGCAGCSPSACRAAIDRVKADIAKVEPLLAQVDALNQSLARGEGSIMKLMRDPEFPEDAKELGKIMKRQPWKIIDRPATK